MPTVAELLSLGEADLADGMHWMGEAAAKTKAKFLEISQVTTGSCCRELIPPTAALL